MARSADAAVVFRNGVCDRLHKGIFFQFPCFLTILLNPYSHIHIKASAEDQFQYGFANLDDDDGALT
ncbi:hypothetical protein ACSBR1_007213 [Camellia fascicularis]